MHPDSRRPLARSLAACGLIATFVAASSHGAPPVFETPWRNWITGTYESVETGWYPEDLALGDLDGDGWLELLVANDGPSTQPHASVLRGKRDGWSPAMSLPLARTSQGVAVGDLDGDGDLDAVFTEGGINGEGNTAAVLLNDGSGSLVAGGAVASGPGPSGVEIADLER